jgi:hypothetical protein
MKVRARDGTCRRREEEKARRERKWKKDMQVLEGILELKVANEVAEFAGQFFDLVDLDTGGAIATSCLLDDTESEAPQPAESSMPLSSMTAGVGSSTMFFEASSTGAPDDSE